MPHNATEKEEKEALTPQQVTALEQLLSGGTVTAAAGAAQIDRSTLHRWLKEDYVFQARLNQLKRELVEAVEARLLTIVQKATQAVENAVDEGNLVASLAVLKGMGALSGMPARPGPEDPAVLRDNTELAREEAELVKAELKQSRLMRRLTVS